MYVAVGDLDKACFFYNESRVCCEMMRHSEKVKARLYRCVGDLCIYTSSYMWAVTFFKKSLQYAWYSSSNEMEIDLYDQLGIAYYY